MLPRSGNSARRGLSYTTIHSGSLVPNSRRWIASKRASSSRDFIHGNGLKFRVMLLARADDIELPFLSIKRESFGLNILASCRNEQRGQLANGANVQLIRRINGLFKSYLADNFENGLIRIAGIIGECLDDGVRGFPAIDDAIKRACLSDLLVKTRHMAVLSLMPKLASLSRLIA